MNKFSAIFQNNGREPSRAASQETHEEKSQPTEDQTAMTAVEAAEPADVGRVASSLRKGERMIFARARSLLDQAGSSAVNSFVGLLQNQATPADVLRKTLEDVIEFRAADAVLARAADEAALRGIGADTQSAAKTVVRVSH
jgi:hypothetical protein